MTSSSTPSDSDITNCLTSCCRNGYSSIGGCEIRYGGNDLKGCFGVAPGPENMNEDPLGLGIPELGNIEVGDFMRAPESNHVDAEKDLLENNHENYQFFNWYDTWLLNEIISILDDTLTGPDENGNVGLNDILTGALNDDGKIVIDINATLISNLTNVATGEAASLDLISVELGGLNTFSRFDPIRPISNHTIGTSFSIENMSMSMNFMITMSDQEYHDDMKGSVKVDFGLGNVALDLAILAAFIEPEFLAIKLGSLLDASIDPNELNQFGDAFLNATKCLLYPMYKLEISSLNLTLGELVGPTTSGVGFETDLKWTGTSTDTAAVTRCSSYVTDTQCEVDLGCLWNYKYDFCDGSLLTYQWSSGTVIWNDDASRWSDVGYFDANHFEVQVRPSRLESIETEVRKVNLPRAAQIFALSPTSEEELEDWADCEQTETYRQEFMIAQASLDNVLVQYV